MLDAAEADIAATAKQYSGGRSSFERKFHAELSRNADNDLSSEAWHHNGWAAMVRMTFTLYAGAANNALRQRDEKLACRERL